MFTILTVEKATSLALLKRVVIDVIFRTTKASAEKALARISVAPRYANPHLALVSKLCNLCLLSTTATARDDGLLAFRGDRDTTDVTILDNL